MGNYMKLYRIESTKTHKNFKLYKELKPSRYIKLQNHYQYKLLKFETMYYVSKMKPPSYTSKQWFPPGYTKVLKQ